MKLFGDVIALFRKDGCRKCRRPLTPNPFHDGSFLPCATCCTVGSPTHYHVPDSASDRRAIFLRRTVARTRGYDRPKGHGMIQDPRNGMWIEVWYQWERVS